MCDRTGLVISDLLIQLQAGHEVMVCDERIQKIQTIKMLEGIFICAAPHCLKSFLKRSLFEAHINETHADLLQLNADREEPTNENDSFMATSRPSSASSDLHPKPPILPEPSTSRAQSRPIAPTSHNPGILASEREDKVRRSQSKEQLAPPPAMKQPPQLRPPLYGRPLDQQVDSAQQNFDRLPPPPPFGRFPQHQNNFDLPMGPPRKDSELFPEKQESPSVQDYVPSQGQFPPALPPSYAYPPPVPVAPDGSSQPFYYDASRTDLPSSEGVPEQQGSLLGFPSVQHQGMYNFQDSNYSRPWNMGLASGQSTSYDGLPGIPGPQGSYIPNQSSDFPGPRVPFFQGDGGRVMVAFTAGKASDSGGNASSVGGADYQEGKGVLAPLPPPPPLPLPPPHLKRGKFGGPPHDSGRDGYGWQHHDKRSYSGSQD
ncbi:unnamed protein product [Victoria cruziana]